MAERDFCEVSLMSGGSKSDLERAKPLASAKLTRKQAHTALNKTSVVPRQNLAPGSAYFEFRLRSRLRAFIIEN